MSSGPRVGRWSGDSVPGLVRSHNEDRFGHAGSTVFVVADGMGGHQGGAIAAQTVVDAVCGVPSMMFDLGADHFAQTVNTAVLTVAKRAGVEAAGSTMAVLAVRSGRAMVVNTGDSRVYLLRGDRLAQLTNDQNVEGLATSEQLSSEVRGLLDGEPAGALLAYMGMRSTDVSVQSVPVDLEAGDRFLLCSDGIHRQVDHGLIQRCLQLDDVGSGVAEILRLADDSGGSDNATAVIVTITGAVQ